MLALDNFFPVEGETPTKTLVICNLFGSPINFSLALPVIMPMFISNRKFVRAPISLEE